MRVKNLWKWVFLVLLATQWGLMGCGGSDEEAESDDLCSVDTALIDGQCVSEQTVACSEAGVPANAHAVAGEVTISFTDSEGWTEPGTCAFECDADFTLIDGSCINQQKVPCAQTAVPANGQQVEAPVAIAYTDAGGWTAPDECEWECNPDYADIEGECINQQTVPCLGIVPPDNAHEVEGEVVITYSSDGGWSLAEKCAWECDADYELVGEACLDEQTVPCAEIEAPANAHQVDAEVTVTYTDADGWTAAADCDWECDADYDLVVDACINEQSVACADIVAPANGHQIDEEVLITYTDVDGWTVAPDCEWACDADYDLVVDACLNEQTVACADIVAPANAHQIASDVPITYTDADGWTVAADCAWECDADFDLVVDACLNEQTVDCTDVVPPANATQVEAQVLITYTDLDGWTVAADCAWECDADYDLIVDACLNEQSVDCADIVSPDYAHQVEEQVLITYTDLDGWTTPADCAWECDDGFLSSNDLDCDLCDNDGGYWDFGLPDICSASSWAENGASLGLGVEVELVADGQGGVIVVWQEDTPGNTDIRAQRVGPDGFVVDGWPENGTALCTDAEGQYEPAITLDSAGGAIVAWRDARGPTHSIYAARVLLDGTLDPDWSQDGEVIYQPPGEDMETLLRPMIATDEAGGAYIVFRGYPGVSQSMGFIMIARIASDGTFPVGWEDGPKSLAVIGYNNVPFVLPDGEGGAWVTWQGNTACRVTRVAADGTMAPGWGGNGIAIAQDHSPYCLAPAVDHDHNLLLSYTFSTIQWVTGQDIFVQGVKHDGTFLYPALGGYSGVLVSAGEFHEWVPVVAADGVGGVFLAWEDVRAGDDIWDNTKHEIYAAHILANGDRDPAWPEYWLQLSSAETGYHQIPQIMPDGAGGAYVTWFRTEPGGGGVGEAEARVVRIAVEGTFAQGWSLDGVTLYDVETTSAAHPRLAGDGGNGAFVAWVTSVFFDSIPTVQRVFGDAVIPVQ